MADSDDYVQFNFCASFVPEACPNIQPAYSFLVTQKQMNENENKQPKDYINQHISYQQIKQEQTDSTDIDQETISENKQSENIDTKQDQDIEDKTQNQPDKNIDDDEHQIQDQQQNKGQQNQGQKQDQIQSQKQKEEDQQSKSDIRQQDDDQNSDLLPIASYECKKYSSDSYSYLFHKSYTAGVLKLTLQTQLHENNRSGLQTQFYISCSDQYFFEAAQAKIEDNVLKIYGQSKYGCPVFQVSSLWRVFEDNWVIFGIIFVIVGLYLLFYGRVTLSITVFLATFFIIFGILGAVATVFVSPYTTTFLIYFTFILLLFISTIIAYYVTKLLDLSVFFIGAFLGLIVGALVNSIFMKLTGIYSVWSLVIFIIIFAIPFGLLTFKYSNPIIIASTSLTGSYLIVRPISWIFGGFPNQFIIYHLIETNSLKTLPWQFFLYLIVIIGLAIVGAMYQILKLNRQEAEQTGEQVEINILQQTIQQPIDRLKDAVDGFIERYRSRQVSEENLEELRQSGKYYKMDNIKSETKKKEGKNIKQ